jgi:hypothetical protein
MSPLTNCGLPHAAPVAAAKVRPSSIQAGLVIMLATNRHSSAAATGLAATTDSKAFMTLIRI